MADALPQITIDPRQGSGELKPMLDALGMRTELSELPAGDFAFDGDGPRGISRIGIERKRLTDLLQCMRDARLVGKQLPRMIELYDIRYLMVEGLTRANPATGILEEGIHLYNNRKPVWWRDALLGRQRFLFADYDKYIASLEWAPVRVRRTVSPEDTCRQVAALWSYYNDKRWDQHKSLGALYYAPMPSIAFTSKEDMVRQVAAALPMIGPERSLACSLKWRTVWDMMSAPAGEWETLPGVGPGIAGRVWEAIHNGRKDDRSRD